MRQIKVNTELFSKYRKDYKGQITVYENSAKQEDIYIPIQHIIVVKDTNKVLDVITFVKEYSEILELGIRYDLLNVETAQKELDNTLAKKAKYEARQKLVEQEYTHTNKIHTNTLADFIK